MSKIFWYYCVIAIGVALMLITMIKKKNFLDLFSFFLSATALGYLCEVLSLFVLGSYQYKPGLFKDYIAEDIFGHLVCNGFFWGGTAVFVAAFSLNSLWILFISFFYMLVELWFLKVGAYEHHWWRLYMTGIAAFVIFTAIKKWLLYLQGNKYQLLRKFTFFMIAWVILQGTSVILNLLDKQHFIIGFVQNIYQDSIFFSVPYQLCLAAIYSFFGSANKRWYYTLLPLVLNIVMDSFFAFINILNFYNGWNLFYFEFLRILGFILFILLEKHTLYFEKLDLLKNAKA